MLESCENSFGALFSITGSGIAAGAASAAAVTVPEDAPCTCAALISRHQAGFKYHALSNFRNWIKCVPKKAHVRV